MRNKRAADETRRRRSRAVFLYAFDARRDHLRMIRQAEIVVRAKTRDLSVTAQTHARVHRSFDHLQDLELAAVFELLKTRAGALFEEIEARQFGRIHGIILAEIRAQ